MRSNGDAAKDPRQLEHEVEQQRRQIGETINALEDKFSPGEIYSQAAGYFRNYGGDFTRNLSESIKANPLPVALTAVGLAWMMMGQRRTQGAGYRAYDRPRHDHDVTNDIYGNSTSVYGHNEAEGYPGGESKTDKLKNKGEQLKGKGAEFKGKMASAKERASASGQDLRHRASATGQQLRESASHAREGFYNSVGSARSNFDYYMREQPLAVGAIGIALGALFGAAMPRTKAESRALGDLNERARHKAKEMAEEGYQKASQVGESVRQQAEQALHSERGSSQQPSSTGAKTQGPSTTP